MHPKDGYSEAKNLVVADDDNADDDDRHKHTLTHKHTQNYSTNHFCAFAQFKSSVGRYPSVASQHNTYHHFLHPLFHHLSLCLLPLYPSIFFTFQLFFFSVDITVKY